MPRSNFYVYVYIDPRNFEEFYYGKGVGARKASHLQDDGRAEESNKRARIRAIRKARLEPIIRVVAAGLTSDEAHLVETALIWRLGSNLTNVAPGRDVEKFRPRDSMHFELDNFDFRNGIYYVNVGEGDARNWDDCLRYGFLAAGGHPRWSDPIRRLNRNDIVAAYLKGRGFVGIGRVTHEAVPSHNFQINRMPISALELVQRNLGHDFDNLELCEYLVKVDWLRAVPREGAKWKRKAGLFTTAQVRASLANQTSTKEFLEQEFGVSLAELADSTA